ncbi:MAG TPA: DUF2520 domain-containing protein [Saprospiraceae bacterium]|nr:DUF2520 domain-containing protein [Saprospiraceae bacterium]
MRICLIGAGNVGTQLGLAFYKAGHQVIQVFNRGASRAEKLASLISSEPISSLQNLKNGADVYILAVKDDAISDVFNQIRSYLSDSLVMHTAGSVPMTIFTDHSRHGVLWPVQTFSRSHKVDMRGVPLAITGNIPETTLAIEALAKSISDHVYHIDDTQRAFLHLAATFASNFSNHMYTLSRQITEAQDIPFDILKPLIQETALKIQRMSPEEAQTGAAVRRDEGTILRHLLLMKENTEMKEVYELLTKSIQSSSENAG